MIGSLVSRWRTGRDRTGNPIETPSIAAWVREHHIGEVWELAPMLNIEKSPPRTLEPSVHPRFTRSSFVPVPARELARLPGATLETPSGCAWPPDSVDDGMGLKRPRVVLPDGSVSLESTQGLLRRCLPRPAREVTHRPGGYCSLLTPWSIDGNYYHWLLDVIVPLYSVVDRIPDQVRFVVPPELRPFQYESLELLGISPSRLVPFPPPRGLHRVPTWRFDELWFTPPGRLDPPAISAFRSLVLGRAQRRRASPRRIYISRDDAAYRRLVNEVEVTKYLSERGFECHLLTGMSLTDQADLFREAEVILGPHGAGFTNMMFAPPGATIIDIQSTDVDHFFHNVSLALGHVYWYTVGSDRPSGTSYRSNIDVSIDALDATLTAALAH